MDGTSAITAISSVIASTVKIAEKTFEICAVDDQAKAVLQTVNQVSDQLNNARRLRRQKSAAFAKDEKRMLDDTFRQTEDAIQQIARLTERARADMAVGAGKVKVNTRLLYVLRDSPNVHVSLTKLGIASQSLSMALFLLMNRECRSSDSAERHSSPHPGGPTKISLRPPPTYEESTFIAEKRLKNQQRRASAQSLNPKPLSVRSRSTSSLSEYQYEPSEGVSELEGIEPERNRFSSRSVPSICVSQTDLQDDDLDFLLFQQAIGFTPPPSITPRPIPVKVPPDVIKMQTTSNFFSDPRPAPVRALSNVVEMQTDAPFCSDARPTPVRTTSNVIEMQTDDHTSPDFIPAPEQRSRGWSSSARLQADELCMDANSLYASSADSRSIYSRPTNLPSVRSESIYSRPQDEEPLRMPWPDNDPLSQENQTNRGQARQEANEAYFDWYSPASLSYNLSTQSLPVPAPPARKGRAERFYQARCQ